MILVDAVYINVSGGKVLLEFLIETVLEKKLEGNFFFLLDQRLETRFLKMLPEKSFQVLDASESERKIFYKNMPFQFTSVFCFANVPPPCRLIKERVFILFHNALILDSVGTQYDLLTSIKFILKRWYIRWKSFKKYTWIVQTKTMFELMKTKLDLGDSAIKILPVYDTHRFVGLNKQLVTNNNNYLYVADGVKQKNHDLLLQSWEIIYDTLKLPITLHLTIPVQFVTLLAEIERLKAKGVLIVNHGLCTFTELKALYTICNYYITPSLAESFGLPIVEAATAGCEIIAANLGYVYDVVMPLATFDPYNAKDLAACIASVYEKRTTGVTKIIIKNEIESLLSLLYNV